MTPEDVRNYVMNAISSSWATCTAIAQLNIPFTAPKAAAWIRPNIKMGPSFVGEIGEQGIGIRTGSIMIEIFVPAGSGTKTAAGYATRLEAILKRKDIGGVLCQEPSTDFVGIIENGDYKMLTSCDFEAFVA